MSQLSTACTNPLEQYNLDSFSGYNISYISDWEKRQQHFNISVHKTAKIIFVRKGMLYALHFFMFGKNNNS